MKKVFFIRTTVFLSLISLNSNLLYGDMIKYSNGIYNGEVKHKFPKFWEKTPHGRGKFTYTNSDFYDGDWVNGQQTGKGEFTIANKETKKPLYTHVYDENGIMNNVEYLYKEKSLDRLVVNYNGINKALNRNEINDYKDLMKYIFICNKDGNKIEDQSSCNIELIKQCAQYQMQNRLGDKSDENRMDDGRTGLQNLVILAKLNNNIDALKRTRFEIEQNNSNWPTNTYNDIEPYLNSLGLTTNNNSSENSDLVSMDTLIGNGISYFSINMRTTTNDHAVSGTIDLNKIKQNEKDFIYVYDSSRIIDDPDEKGNLGNLQHNCQLFNHVQQRLGSCWYHASCSTITAAEHPEIVGKIRNKEILSISMNERYVNNSVKFNGLELLQMLKLQKTAEDLGIERLGRKTQEQEFTKSGNRPRMTYQIVNYNTRKAIKNCLNNKMGTYKSLLFIAKEEGLDVEDLDSEFDTYLVFKPTSSKKHSRSKFKFFKKHFRFKFKL